MAENKWDYEELTFQEIDLSPLRQGKPAKSFKYTSEDRKSGFVISIFKSKKNGKYYAKVELAKKIDSSTSEEVAEDITEEVSQEDKEDIPF